MTSKLYKKHPLSKSLKYFCNIKMSNNGNFSKLAPTSINSRKFESYSVCIFQNTRQTDFTGKAISRSISRNFRKKMSFSGMIFKIKMHKILYGLLLLIDQLIGQCSSDTKEEDNLHLYRLPFNGP